jgi:hypothetical protein
VSDPINRETALRMALAHMPAAPIDAVIDTARKLESYLNEAASPILHGKAKKYETVRRMVADRRKNTEIAEAIGVRPEYVSRLRRRLGLPVVEMELSEAVRKARSDRMPAVRAARGKASNA